MLCEDEDRQRALTKLRDICLKLHLGPLGKFLKDKLSTLQSPSDKSPPPDLSIAGSDSLAANILLKTLLILGKTGSGKSTLCNRLAGENHDSDSFPVDSSASSCTQENVLKNVNFGGDKKRKVMLIDTVGFDDPDKGQEVIDELARKMNGTSINTFGITVNGHSKRLDKSRIKMLEGYEKVFGAEFWKNCILIFTQMSMDQASIAKRDRTTHKSDDRVAKDFIEEVHKRFPKSEGLGYLFLDACFDQESQSETTLFKGAIEKLYSNMSGAADFQLPTTRQDKNVQRIKQLPLEIEIKSEEQGEDGSRDQELVTTQTENIEGRGANNEPKRRERKRQRSDDDDKRDYLKRHKDMNQFHEKILDYPYPGRLSIAAWTAETRKGKISKPMPVTYHRRYQTNPSFLKDSFKGEALPGVFRPSDSGLNEEEAKEMFNRDNPMPPPSLAVLNKWTYKKFCPPLPKFDKKYHSIEKKGFDELFYAQMRPLKFSEVKDPEEDDGRSPHRVWDKAEAEKYVQENFELLQPLAEFIADASLTTIGPPKEKWNDYIGYCVKPPDKDGLLIAKVMFDYNALSYDYITRNTKVGICAICGGLLALPHHVVALCYWWPEGLKDSQLSCELVFSL